MAGQNVEHRGAAHPEYRTAQVDGERELHGHVHVAHQEVHGVQTERHCACKTTRALLSVEAAQVNA